MAAGSGPIPTPTDDGYRRPVDDQDRCYEAHDRCYNHAEFVAKLIGKALCEAERACDDALQSCLFDVLMTSPLLEKGDLTRLLGALAAFGFTHRCCN